MKREKIYEFPIDNPLTPAKRKAVEKYVEQSAEQLEKPLAYSWDEDDRSILHIAAEPVLVEVRFEGKKVELYGSAPLWARLLFTEKKKTALKEQIESILVKAKFIAVKKPKREDDSARRGAVDIAAETAAAAGGRRRRAAQRSDG